jgi:signal transduction histidine kinase
MSVEMHLYELAKHVQELLCCDGVCVLLGCAEPALCHPLLQRLPGTTPYVASTCSTLPPLQNESVAALCDIASQTGTMWEIAAMRLSDNSTAKLIVSPLELPDGLLGLLLFCYNAPKDFSVDDFLRLQQCLPVVLQYLQTLLVREQPEYGGTQEVAKASRQHELLSMVSHELRMPLAAIKGYTVLLQTYGYGDTPTEISAEAMSPEQRRHYLAAIMEQIDYLETLVSDLLDVSQLQTGHLTLHPAQVDVEALCQSVIKQISYRVGQQQPGCYTFRCQVEDELPLAWADPTRVRQILINLIENAVKYSPDGGQIEIILHTEQVSGDEVDSSQTQDASRLALSEKKVCITVCDGGIGIPLQQQTALFKPFTRLEHLLSKNIPGNGLGLYISRKLVEAMQGQLFLISGEGQGTCVTFTLPIADAPVAALFHQEEPPLC